VHHCASSTRVAPARIPFFGLSPAVSCRIADRAADGAPSPASDGRTGRPSGRHGGRDEDHRNDDHRNGDHMVAVPDARGAGGGSKATAVGAAPAGVPPGRPVHRASSSTGDSRPPAGAVSRRIGRSGGPGRPRRRSPPHHRADRGSPAVIRSPAATRGRGSRTAPGRTGATVGIRSMCGRSGARYGRPDRPARARPAPTAPRTRSRSAAVRPDGGDRPVRRREHTAGAESPVPHGGLASAARGTGGPGSGGVQAGRARVVERRRRPGGERADPPRALLPPAPGAGHASRRPGGGAVRRRAGEFPASPNTLCNDSPAIDYGK